jgi:DNA-binding MarR family transcriptional regulator
LVSGGFLTRSVSATDRRVCELALAEPTQQIVDASRAARRALLSQVIGELDNDQIESLAKGLEVLDTMTRLLEERRS